MAWICDEALKFAAAGPAPRGWRSALRQLGKLVETLAAGNSVGLVEAAMRMAA